MLAALRSMLPKAHWSISTSRELACEAGRPVLTDLGSQPRDGLELAVGERVHPNRYLLLFSSICSLCSVIRQG